MLSKLKNLGPGLLFAGAAVGVSHLVQSTRAGALYGFSLVAVIILANLLRYPFFEFGPRYTAATGNSLLQGYFKMNRAVFGLFMVFILVTMFMLQGAVTIVTAGLIEHLFGTQFGSTIVSIGLLGLCAVILILGHFRWLNRLMKFVIVALTVSTLTALIGAVMHGPVHPEPLTTHVLWSEAGFIFLIALMGWMPAPIEISVMHSIWSQEQARDMKAAPNLKTALFDFNFGYIGTALLALVFLSLGALILHGSPEPLSNNSATFAGQLIQLYTQTLGDWSWLPITIAALATMFSTTLTVLDAYPRIIRQACYCLAPTKINEHARTPYILALLTLAGGALLIISQFQENMKGLVTLATVLSFLTAPFFAYLNYHLITKSNLPDSAKIPTWLKWLSLAGLTYLSIFSLIFIATLLR